MKAEKKITTYPMTLAQFCEKWKLCRQKVYSEIGERRLPVVRVGNRYRITMEQEAAWVALCSTSEPTTLEKIRGVA